MRCKLKARAAKAKCMKWCKSLVEITRNAGIKVRVKRGDLGVFYCFGLPLWYKKGCKFCFRCMEVVTD